MDTALRALAVFLQQLWADPLYRWAVLGTTAVSMGAFALFAGSLTLLAWREPAWARPWRIQSRRPRAQTLVGPSVARWMFNNLAFTALVSAAWRWLPGPGVHLGPAPSVWELAAQFVFFVYVDDFLYYWVHRAMHTPWLFKRVHGVHHRILTPWAITGHYMHPLEFVLTGSLALAVPWLVGAVVGVDHLPAVGGRRGTLRVRPAVVAVEAPARQRRRPPPRRPPRPRAGQLRGLLPPLRPLVWHLRAGLRARPRAALNLPRGLPSSHRAARGVASRARRFEA